MEQNNNDIIEEGYTIVEFLRSLRKNIFLLLLIGMVFVAGGVFYTWVLVTPMYSSNLGISIAADENKIDKNINPQQVQIGLTQAVNEVTATIKTNDMGEEIAKKLQGIYQEESLSASMIRSTLTIQRVDNSFRIYIVSTHTDAKLARDIVIATYEVLEEKVKENKVPFMEQYKIGAFDRPSAVSTVPTSPNKKLNIIVSILLGGIVGVVIVLIKERFNSKFTSKEEIERELGYPVFSTIPLRTLGEKGDHNE